MNNTKSVPQFVAHPWHGVSLGEDAPQKITAFIEVVPEDTGKFEIDKDTGLMRLDRPQKYSNAYPCLYGFLPRTYCEKASATLCEQKSGLSNLHGDLDPLDICVLTSNRIRQGNILVTARPIGGLRMLDQAEVDDKIIAVLDQDPAYESIKTLSDLPKGIVDKISHYFLTYKDFPTNKEKKIHIKGSYEVAEAHEVIQASITDYNSNYGQ